MKKNLRKAVGSLMVVGLGTHELSRLERTWLRLIGPSGVILFARNINNAQQTQSLLNDAAKLCAEHPFACVDVEGGSVDRLRSALAPIPSAQRVANTGRPIRMREHGELIARAVTAFGFNTTLAPVLDLSTPLCSPVMGTRTASPFPAAVIEYAREFLVGLATGGVIGCGKHFPGLGGATLDSHILTPAIDRQWSELWRDDLAPYRELHSQLPMIMVNHAAYPSTRGIDKPASISSFWITTVLRKRINYKGLILSDDMEMGGILKSLPIEQAAVASVRAGMDLLEICHTVELILECYEALLHEAERSESFCTLVMNRAAAVARHRSRFFGRSLRAQPSGKLPSPKQMAALRDRILRFSACIEKEQPV